MAVGVVLGSAPLGASGGDYGTGTSYAVGAGVFASPVVDDNIPSLFGGITLDAAMAHSVLWYMSESAAFSDTAAVGEIIATLREIMAADDAVIGGVNSLLALAEAFQLSDATTLGLLFILSDTASVASPAVDIIGYVQSVVDRVYALSSIELWQDALIYVAEAFTLTSLASSGWAVSAITEAEIADTLGSVLEMLLPLADSGALASPAVDTLRLVAALSDSAEAASPATTVAALFESLADGGSFFVALRLGDAEYTAWVMNAASKAVVEYRNFPFNSFAYFNGRYYGASENGVFELTGADDDGEEIAAWVRSALSNLGTGRKKRLPSMYLGYKSDGNLVLKVVHTSPSGTKVEDWYEVQARDAVATREHRAKIGRGIQSVYYAWELHNVAGADFDISDVELFPILLERRI